MTTTITITRPWAGDTSEDLAFARASHSPDYFGWLDHVSSAAGCSHPIGLSGRVTTRGISTGAMVTSLFTEGLPDGLIYKNCDNRRDSLCPSCSTSYRRDAYQLIRAGLDGGKTVPRTIAARAAVFATFAAPGFGHVHARRNTSTGKAISCRPRRKPDRCPHGVDLRCDCVHVVDEKAFGRPLGRPPIVKICPRMIWGRWQKPLRLTPWWHTVTDRLWAILPGQDACRAGYVGAPGSIRTCDTRFRNR
jgi:replication initiator protein RepSA